MILLGGFKQKMPQRALPSARRNNPVLGPMPYVFESPSRGFGTPRDKSIEP